MSALSAMTKEASVAGTTMTKSVASAAQNMGKEQHVTNPATGSQMVVDGMEAAFMEKANSQTSQGLSL